MYGPEGPSVSIRSTTGMDRTEHRFMTRGTRAGGMMYKTASNASADMVEMAAVPMPESAVMEEEMALNETVVAGYAAAKMDDALAMDADMGADIAVREDFAKTVAFEPFLRSDSNGTVISLRRTSCQPMLYSCLRTTRIWTMPSCGTKRS